MCFFTGTRAEYGILKNLFDEAMKCDDIEFQLVVSGMHLSPEFGLTLSEIEKDGFSIDDKVEILLSSDTPLGMLKSMGLGLLGYGETLNRLKPDMVIALGDRYEVMAFTIASTVLRIPVAHIHGGEITEGVFDEAFRHCITKMSHLHFTSTEDYRKRVVQMGEQPDRVFNVGALGIDNIMNLTLIPKRELESKLNFRFGSHNVLVTYHPETLEPGMSKVHFDNLLEVLRGLVDTKIIFTKANADPEGWAINGLIEEFVVHNSDKALSFSSLGVLDYLSMMQYIDAVVGNSSSGIIEAPSLKKGTINIGNRQKGRIRARSVIDCEPTKESIIKAFERLFSMDFQKELSQVENPYGEGKAAHKIIELLNQNISLILNNKKAFFDIQNVSW